MGSLHSSAFSTQSQKIAGLTTQRGCAGFHFGPSLDLLPTRIVLWTRARMRFSTSATLNSPNPERQTSQTNQHREKQEEIEHAKQGPIECGRVSLDSRPDCRLQLRRVPLWETSGDHLSGCGVLGLEVGRMRGDFGPDVGGQGERCVDSSIKLNRCHPPR